MTYDEDAAKVLTKKIYNHIVMRRNYDPHEVVIRDVSKHIEAFGRRCAEAMREECHTAVMKQRCERRTPYDQAILDAAQAIRRVEVK